MTSSEKEVAREKRRQELKNASKYDEKMEDSRVEDSAGKLQKRKYLKRSEKGDPPVFQPVVNDKGAAIGKKDQHGNFYPYKRRGRTPKNLGQRQTGLASPKSGDDDKTCEKTDIELEDMLAAEVQKREDVAAARRKGEPSEGTQSEESRQSDDEETNIVSKKKPEAKKPAVKTQSEDQSDSEAMDVQN